MEAYEEILERIAGDVSLGYQTILVHRSPVLHVAQIGYSITPTGEPLNSDWPENWLVIGHEELCGDPIFIDTSAPGFPVYTAMHGEDSWEAEPIATTLESFGRALNHISRISVGRETPVALENNPIAPSEKDAVLAAIERDNPGVKRDFWEVIFAQD